MILAAALLSLMAASPDAAEPAADKAPAERYVPVGVPTATFNTDEGFGFGVTGSIFHYDGVTRPFRDDLSLVVFITTRLVQRYELRWEGLNAFDTPLRVWARGGYFSTVTQNFCGFGSELPCDLRLAELEARRAGLAEGSEAYDEFVRRYYLLRFIRLHADLNARWKLKDGEHKVELLFGYRGAYYIPGQIGELGPYPGSLYAKAFPSGEPGFLSAPFVGVVLDGRDNEPAPNHGYFIEASVRGAHPFIGSAWSHAGLNFSGAVFVPLLRDRVILGSRVLVDLIGGEVPVDELQSVGGTRVRPAYGGMWLGRGVRQQRYNGKIKLVSQNELRSGFLTYELWGLGLGLGAALFVDAGWIAYDWDDLVGFVPGQPVTATAPRLVVTWGGGLRINFNESFVIRVDLGFSADESAPGLYMPVGNAF